jgi:hypothetical protein
MYEVFMISRMAFLSLMTLPFLLEGCGIAAKVDARNDMLQSKAAYKNCLAQNPDNVSACEAAESAYEADLAAYQATTAGLRRDTSDDQ